MPKWEYKKIDLNDIPVKTYDIDLLNDAGENGWELVVITTYNAAFLKRPIEEQAEARSARRKAGAASAA